MKTSVTMQKYTVKLGLLLIVMFVALMMYGWSEGGVSHANRYCTSDFATVRLSIFSAYETHFGCVDTKIRSGVDMKPNLLMKCRYFCFMKFIKCNF
jgi:hypothetical protein